MNAMPPSSSTIAAVRAGAVPVGPLPAGHPGVKIGRIGVLLTNLGTPEGTDYWSMRRYLREFLSDRRVIETNRVLWWAILNLVILTIRPGRKGKDYASIWNHERNESPLKTITRAQSDALAAAMDDPRVSVDWAMRYGKPAIADRLKALVAQGCDRILLVPLYPQYAGATSATACDHAFRALMAMRWQPSLRVAPPYHDDPAYIEALCAKMLADLAKLDFEPEVVLASFHGVPREYLLKGDPYHCHCVKTYRLMREHLGWSAERFQMSFQSRFGRAEWLRPYTDETIKALAAKGVKRMAILAPGFSADCLETLEELAVENREYFTHAGGERYAYLPCLNAEAEGVRVIRTVVDRELMGWL